MTRRPGVVLAFALVLAAIPVLVRDCALCAHSGSILISGTVPGKCTVAVSTDSAAANLPITANGTQRVQVATALQDCTGNRSYVLTVSSMNCAFDPVGAKLRSVESSDYLRYSVEFNNPTTGGSQPIVTGLLESACTEQIAREVNKGKTSNETSTVFVNFAGLPGLAAGVYQDVVTISLNMK
jgi:hypothetical protein